MTNIVQHKRGTTVPIAGDLSVGEIGINMTSQRIYTKNTGGTIIELSPSTPAGADKEVQFNNGGSAFGSDSTFTFDAGTDKLTVANVDVSTTANLGAVGNVTITGGSDLQSLITDGSGVLSWGYSNGIQNGTSSVTIPAQNGNINITGTTGNTVLLSPTLTMNGAIIQRHSALGAGSSIDLRVADYFSKTITAATTLSVTNTAASNYVSSFILVLTNGGSAAVTWWAGVKWEAGVAPTLTASGVDILGFFTYDNGTTWRGLVLALDSK